MTADEVQMQQIINHVVDGLMRDAARYRWIRAQGGSWESEAFLSGLTPEEYDRELDRAVEAAKEGR